jgi:hypothetical protein
MPTSTVLIVGGLSGIRTSLLSPDRNTNLISPFDTTFLASSLHLAPSSTMQRPADLSCGSCTLR